MDAPQLPMQFANIPATADARIPLSVKAPVEVDTLGETSRAYTLASQMDKRDDEVLARNDKQLIQQELQAGANMSTPDGIESLAKSLKGKVQPATYESLVKAKSTLEESALKVQERLATVETEKLLTMQKQSDVALRSMSGLLEEFETTKKDKGLDVAMNEFGPKKEATLKALADSGVVPPQVIQQMQAVSPTQLKNLVQTSKFWQEQMRIASEIQERQARAKKEEAQAKALEQGGAQMATLQALIEKYGEDSKTVKDFKAKMFEPKTAGGVGMNEDNITPQERALAVRQWIQNPSSMRGMDKTYQQRVISWAASMGITPDDVNKGQALQKFDISAARASGTRAGQMASVEATMPGLIDEALDASAKVPRGNFVPFNKLVQMLDTSIGSPELRRLKIANQAVASEYQQVISRGGTNVTSLQEAMHLLQTADSPEAYSAAMNQIKREIAINVQGAEKVREKTAPKNTPEARIDPKEQAERDASAVEILKAEQTRFGKQLEQLKANPRATPEDISRVQRDLDGVTREIAREQRRKDGAPKAASTGQRPKVTSREDLVAAFRDKKIKVGDTFIGPDGEERTLKKAPE
jgi:hypothetical protein